MITQPWRAVHAFSQALPLLFSRQIRLFVLTPIVANCVLMALIFFVAFFYSTDAVNYLMSFLPGWLSFMNWLFYLIFGAVVIVLIFYGFSVGVNIIAAPFMALLAEKTETVITGKVFDDTLTFSGILSILGRSLMRELHKLMYFLPRLIGLFILSFIPVINLVAPLLLLFFSAWMLALQYMDYAFDNNKVSFHAMRAALRASPLQCWTFGFIVMVGMAVPLLNLIMMPLAVVAATLLWVESHASSSVPRSV